MRNRKMATLLTGLVLSSATINSCERQPSSIYTEYSCSVGEEEKTGHIWTMLLKKGGDVSSTTIMIAGEDEVIGTAVYTTKADVWYINARDINEDGIDDFEIGYSREGVTGTWNYVSQKDDKRGAVWKRSN